MKLAEARPREPRVNDCALRIATVNGTGSASANDMLMQAIFRMGIPISGKNVFPSNIQGLPTWYEIRINGQGHTARSARFDLVVAMNRETFAQDIADLVPGGFFLYDSSWPFDESLRRTDIQMIGLPIAKMCVEAFEGARVRILMKNIVYVGALVALLDLDTDVVRDMLTQKFAKKAKLLDSNLTALRLGSDYVAEHYACPLPIRLESMRANDGKILIDGNTAAALGCVYAGATVGAWYPITPSTSLMDAFGRFCRRYRTSPAGEKRYIILQAEDELAAAGIVVGAAWAGARAFTNTSGAGISLMTEFIGLAYYAEIGAVFFNIQRAGPSTGMPTRTQQGDFFSTLYASHGDTAHIGLFPAHPGECFTMAKDAFDLAERFQTPVFVLSDLDIGMNDWVVPGFEWNDAYEPDRGKVLTAAQLEKLDKFRRYLDGDGDGIAWRTLPGVHPRGAYVARGSGHDRNGAYTEDGEAYREVVERIKRKIQNARSALPPPVVERRVGAELGIVSVGSCDGAVREAHAHLDAAGIAVDTMRIRGFPFADEVDGFLRAHRKNFVVEQNRDGQLRRLLLLETECERQQLASIVSYGGLPLSAAEILDGLADEIDQRGVRGGEASRLVAVGARA